MSWRPLGMPIGLRETDEFFRVLEGLSGRITPGKHAAERAVPRGEEDKGVPAARATYAEIARVL